MGECDGKQCSQEEKHAAPKAPRKIGFGPRRNADFPCSQPRWPGVTQVGGPGLVQILGGGSSYLANSRRSRIFCVFGATKLILGRPPPKGWQLENLQPCTTTTRPHLTRRESYSCVPVPSSLGLLLRHSLPDILLPSFTTDRRDLSPGLGCRG